MPKINRFFIVLLILVSIICGLPSCGNKSSEVTQVSPDAFSSNGSAVDSAEPAAGSIENLRKKRGLGIHYGQDQERDITVDGSQITYPFYYEANSEGEVAVFMFVNGVPQEIKLDGSDADQAFISITEPDTRVPVDLEFNGRIGQDDKNLLYIIALINEPNYHPTSDTPKDGDFSLGTSNRFVSTNPTPLEINSDVFNRLSIGKTEQIKLDETLRDRLGLLEADTGNMASQIYILPENKENPSAPPFIDKTDLLSGFKVYVLGGSSTGRYRLSLFVNHKFVEGFEFPVYECDLQTNMLSVLNVAPSSLDSEWFDRLEADDVIYLVAASVDTSYGTIFKSDTLVVR